MSTLRVNMKDDAVRHTIDVCAAGVWIAAAVEWLPPVAALMSIIWLGIQIFEYILKKIRGN